MTRRTNRGATFAIARRTVSAAGFALSFAACGESSNDAAPEIAPPPWDSAAVARTLRAGSEPPALKSQGPLTMGVDAAQTRLDNAILYADGGALRFAASAGKELGCNALAPAWGVHYISAAVDAGPKGSFWMGDATPVALVARIPFDTQSARDIHPSTAKIQIGTPALGAAFVQNGEVPAELPVTVESRRTLAQPGTTPGTILNLSGQVNAVVCPSAAQLLARTARGRVDPPAEWVHAEIGGRTFDVKTVLAFSWDDTKNGAAITGLGFYEAEGARCDNATRPLHDDGGGINGLQVEVGPLAIPASRPTWGFTQPVSLDIVDVTAGRGAFAQVYLTSPTLTGHLHVGDVEYKVDPNRNEAGALYGWIRARRDDGIRAVVEGRFTAKICRKP